MPSRKKAYDMSGNGCESDEGHRSLREAMKSKRRSLLSVFSKSSPTTEKVSRNHSFHSNVTSEAPSSLNETSSNIKQLSQDSEVTIATLTDIYSNPSITSTAIINGASSLNGKIKLISSKTVQSHDLVQSQTTHAKASGQIDLKNKESGLDIDSSVTNKNRDGRRSSSSVMDKQTHDYSRHVHTQHGTLKSNEAYFPSNSSTSTSITYTSNALQTDTKMQNSPELPAADYQILNNHSTVVNSAAITRPVDIITSPAKLTGQKKNVASVDYKQTKTITKTSVEKATEHSINSSATSFEGVYTKSEHASTTKRDSTKVDKNASVQHSNSFKAEIKQLLESRYNSLEKSKSVSGVPVENGKPRLHKSTSDRALNTSNLMPTENHQTKSESTEVKTNSHTTKIQISEINTASNIIKRSSSGSAIRSATKNAELSDIAGTGTVDRLAKNLFKNVPLTGGYIPGLPTSPAPKASGDEGNISSPLSTLSPASPQSPVENKRYTYLVEGIDVPSAETADPSAEDGINVPLDITDSGTTEVSGDRKLKKTEGKGFTYLLDRALAAEIKKRAEEAEEGRRVKDEEEKLKLQTERNESASEGDVNLDDLNVNNLKFVFEGSQNTLNSPTKNTASSDSATGLSTTIVDISNIGKPNTNVHAPFVEEKNSYLATLERKQNGINLPRQSIRAEDMATHGTRKTLIISQEKLGVSHENKTVRNLSKQQNATAEHPDVLIEKMADPNNNNAHYDLARRDVANSVETSPRSDFYTVNDRGRSTMFMQLGKQARFQLSPANSTLGLNYTSDTNSDLALSVHTVDFNNDYQSRAEKPQARVIPLQPSLGLPASHSSAFSEMHPASMTPQPSHIASPGIYQSQMVTSLRSSQTRKTSPDMASVNLNAGMSTGFPSQETLYKRNFEVGAKADKNYKMVISPSLFQGIHAQNVGLSENEYMDGRTIVAGDRDVEVMDAYPQVVRFDGNKYSTVHVNEVHRAPLRDLKDFPAQPHSVNVMQVEGGQSRSTRDAGGAGHAFNGSQHLSSSLSSPRDQTRPITPQISQTQKQDSGYRVTLKLNNAGIATNVRASEVSAPSNENYVKTHDTTDSNLHIGQLNKNHTPYLEKERPAKSSLIRLHDDYAPDERDDRYTEVKRYDGGNTNLYQITRMTSTQKPTPPSHYAIHSNHIADHIPSSHIPSATMSVHNSHIHDNKPEVSGQNAYLNNINQDKRTENSMQPAVHISKVFHKTDDLEIRDNHAHTQRTKAHINLSQMKQFPNEDLGSYIQDEVDEATRDVTDPDDTACDIVRGSFLIKNAIDTTSAPKTVDLVEPDDQDLVVDDNVNLFHTRYLTNRENPLYDSNPDLRKIDDFITESKPEFVQQQNISESHILKTHNGVPEFILPGNSYTQYSQPHRTNINIDYTTRIDTGDIDPGIVNSSTVDEIDNRYLPKYSTRTEFYSRRPPPRSDRGLYDFSSRTRPSYSTRYQYGHGNVGNTRRTPYTAGQYRTTLATTETSMPDPTSSSWHYRNEYDKNGNQPWKSSAQSVTGSINTEMEMHMGKGLFRTQHPPNEIFTDRDDYIEEWEKTHASGFPQDMDKREITRKQLDELLGKNLNDAIKQSINVDREDEEIPGHRLLEHADGTATTTDDLLNFDTITENVKLGINKGIAEVQIKVRCERIVPMVITDMFKKSSIIVTRTIEIDLEATDERKRLYKNILYGINKPMISNRAENNWGFKKKSVGEDKTLTMRETFKVYKQLMGIADVEDPVSKHNDLLSESQMEEDHLDGDHFLRAEGFPLTRKKPDDDAVSFMSAATNTSDILF